MRLVDSEQSDKHPKGVKPVRFYGVPLLSIPSARTFRLVALRDLESFVIQNHAALGLFDIICFKVYMFQGNAKWSFSATDFGPGGAAGQDPP